MNAICPKCNKTFDIRDAIEFLGGWDICGFCLTCEHCGYEEEF
jgi:hypothetical protein